jgi:capsular exopolysaccharide synthesis family protein
MEPIAYLKALRRRWRVVAACLLVALVAAWVTAPSAPSATSSLTTYETTATLVPPTTTQASVNLSLAAFLVTELDVAKIAAQKLGGGEDPASLTGAVRAEVRPEISAISVTATDPDRDRSLALAGAFADGLVTYLRESNQERRDELALETKKQLDQTQDSVEKLTEQVEASSGAERALLEAQLQTEQSRYALAYQRYQDLTQPIDTSAELQPLGVPKTIENSPVGISAPQSRKGRLLLVGMLGLLLGLVAALVVDRLDVRLRTREAAEEAFGVSLVAEVPRAPRALRHSTEVAVLAQPGGAVAEGYRTLRSAVLLAPLGGHTSPSPSLVDAEDPRVILVTSARARDGKTTTVANLAAALAEAGKSVLVIDCDLRNPEIHRRLDVAPGLGLSELVGENQTHLLERVISPSSVPNVGVVTAGATAAENPVRLLLRIGGVIEEARTRADVVLVDSPPILTANDTNDLLQYVDAVVLACRVGHVSAEAAMRVRQLVSRAGKPVLALALIGVPPPSSLRPGRGPSSVQPVHPRPRLRFLAPQGDPVDSTTHGLPPHVSDPAPPTPAGVDRGTARDLGESWGRTRPGA